MMMHDGAYSLANAELEEKVTQRDRFKPGVRERAPRSRRTRKFMKNIAKQVLCPFSRDFASNRAIGHPVVERNILVWHDVSTAAGIGRIHRREQRLTWWSKLR